MRQSLFLVNPVWLCGAVPVLPVHNASWIMIRATTEGALTGILALLQYLHISSLVLHTHSPMVLILLSLLQLQDREAWRRNELAHGSIARRWQLPPLWMLQPQHLLHHTVAYHGGPIHQPCWCQPGSVCDGARVFFTYVLNQSIEQIE